MSLIEKQEELVQILSSPRTYIMNGGNESKLCKDLIEANALSLSFPKSVLQSYINRDRASKKQILYEPMKASFVYRKYDRYAFVEMLVVPETIPGIRISERIPETLEQPVIAKDKCWELMDSLPLMLAAIVDYARTHSVVNVHFIIKNVKFHLLDYRKYAYFTCTYRCLGKIFDIA